MEYKLFRSKRKTISIIIRNGEVVVRAPMKAPLKYINGVVEKHDRWIKKHLEKSIEKNNKLSDLSDYDIKRLKAEAKIYFENKTEEFSKIMDLKYSRIKITSAKVRFGSCSSIGTICYSYWLMLYPEAAREYIIVHELCHLVHLNHSKVFYDLLEYYLPDYKARKALLES